MNKQSTPWWDPRSEKITSDQISHYDAMRQKCPVASGIDGYTYIFNHADTLNILNDHKTFSSAVSRYPSVPNGMDPPVHDLYRQLINPYFSKNSINQFLPEFENIAAGLVNTLPSNGNVEFMNGFARAFAVQVQCAFLGWPESLHQPLLDWVQKNHNATLSRNQQLLNNVAQEFDTYIVGLLDARRSGGINIPNDNTTKLLNEKINGRYLSDQEIVSILRNWTVGELGTISASVGILAYYLAANPEVQKLCRSTPSVLPAAIDEILRIMPPLIMNRRITTKNVEISGHKIDSGTRLGVLWASANRDETVFGNPDEFRLDRNPELNLLYGAGVHVCPGAYLSRQELIIVTKALLDGTKNISLATNSKPVKAVFPASGFSELSLNIVKTLI